MSSRPDRRRRERSWEREDRDRDRYPKGGGRGGSYRGDDRGRRRSSRSRSPPRRSGQGIHLSISCHKRPILTPQQVTPIPTVGTIDETTTMTIVVPANETEGMRTEEETTGAIVITTTAIPGRSHLGKTILRTVLWMNETPERMTVPQR